MGLAYRVSARNAPLPDAVLLLLIAAGEGDKEATLYSTHLADQLRRAHQELSNPEDLPNDENGIEAKIFSALTVLGRGLDSFVHSDSQDEDEETFRLSCGLRRMLAGIIARGVVAAGAEAIVSEWVSGAAPPKPSEGTKSGYASRAETFPLHTGQEWTAMLHSADDARRGRHLTPNAQRGTVRHQRPGAHFCAEWQLLDAERDAGHGIELLQNALAELDADDKLIWLYVSHLLAPPEPLPARAFAGDWVDLDDVARKTMGGYAKNPEEAEAWRRKVYHAIRLGARAEIIGQRSIPYKNKTTGEEIDTRLHTNPWGILSKQKPIDPPLWPCETIPLRVELVASREWTALTTRGDTAQFLAFGEVLGAIRGNQPGGAWARSLGLAYLNWCRVHLHNALEGRAPSRKYLLDFHATKTAPYTEVLAGSHPQRALKYWAEAEDLLREVELLEAPKSSLKPPPGYRWQEPWLQAACGWKPGPRLRPVLEALAQNKFPEMPRQLNAAKAPARKRGRPRKVDPSEGQGEA